MKTDKNSDIIRDIHKAKDNWTVENAMHILKHPTVDSKIWAEAVEWLLLYGPPDIQEILLSASGNATSSCFPNITAAGYSEAGETCFPIEEIAKALHIEEEEAERIIEEKEKKHGVRFSLEEGEATKKH